MTRRKNALRRAKDKNATKPDCNITARMFFDFVFSERIRPAANMTLKTWYLDYLKPWCERAKKLTAGEDEWLTQVGDEPPVTVGEMIREETIGPYAEVNEIFRQLWALDQENLRAWRAGAKCLHAGSGNRIPDQERMRRAIEVQRVMAMVRKDIPDYTDERTIKTMTARRLGISLSELYRRLSLPKCSQPGS